MIRRDYIMRAVQEMVQVLARVVFLRSRQEYDQALREINAALRGLAESETVPPTEMSLDEWISLCRKHAPAASGLMVAVADLLREQGDLFVLRQQEAASQRSRLLALGLLLEALLGGDTYVTVELIGKVDALIEETNQWLKSGPLSRRLVHYLAARGRFAMAEDELFRWIETGDPEAAQEGEAFYQRLFAQTDVALVHGNLPRAEAEEGLQQMRKAAARVAQTGSSQNSSS